MTALVLLIALTPGLFHHHKPIPPPMPDPLTSPDPGHPCEISQGVYSYYGPEGSAGYSDKSCADAFSNWRNTPSPSDAYLEHRI